jgi:hypothetical protein
MHTAPEHSLERLRPLSGELSVRTARDLYLDENGFTLATYDAKWTEAQIFGITFKISNTDRHRNAIQLHDLHHAATGYGTDIIGEVEVSAWECRSGVRHLGLYVASIVVGLTLFGLLIAPLRTLRAWSSGAHHRSLFHLGLGYEEIMEMPLGTLRKRLALPLTGLHRGMRMLRSGAPESHTIHDDQSEAPSSAIVLLVEVALLLGGLATYLLLSEPASGRDSGYAVVVAIHLAILSVGCAGVSVRLAARRRSGP